MPLEGAVAYLLSCADHDGQIKIEGILIANNNERVAHLLMSLKATLFVDLELIQSVPGAYLSKSSLQDLLSNETMKDFLTTDLYLKILIEQPTPLMQLLYTHLDAWRPELPINHFGQNTYNRTLHLNEVLKKKPTF